MEKSKDSIQQNIRPIWLSDEEVSNLLSLEDAYNATRDCLLCYEKGDFVQPLKPYVRPQGRNGEYIGGRFIAMPAYLGGEFNMAGLKWIAGFPSNVNRGLPRASGTLQLNCTVTGRVLAIMECATLSAMRTAAIAALAVDLLAPTTPFILTIIGAGPIGIATAVAILSRSRSILSEMRLCDSAPGRAEKASTKLAPFNISKLNCYLSAEEAVRGANVVICATTGGYGYLHADWMTPGWLIVALSLDDANPELFLSADRVIVDDFKQCCREEKLLHRMVKAGRFTEEDIAAELGQIIAGTRSGRLHPTDNVYVNPMGMAIEDIALGTLVYQKATAKGIGQNLA